MTFSRMRSVRYVQWMTSVARSKGSVKSMKAALDALRSDSEPAPAEVT